MKFDKYISLIKQKMSETSIGIERKQNILKTNSVSNINFQEFNNLKFVNDNVFLYLL